MRTIQWERRLADAAVFPASAAAATDARCRTPQIGHECSRLLEGAPSPKLFTLQTAKTVRAAADQSGPIVVGVCRQLLTDATYKLLHMQARRCTLAFARAVPRGAATLVHWECSCLLTSSRARR